MLSLSIRIGPVIDTCQLYTASIHGSLTPSCRNEMQEKESGNQEQEFEYVHLSNKLSECFFPVIKIKLTNIMFLYCNVILSH